MVVPSQHFQYHSLIEVREELEENVMVDEQVAREDVSDGITDNDAAVWPQPPSMISPCSLTEQLLELSTLTDFVTCRDVQAPLHIVQPPEFPKLPNIFTRSIFNDEFLLEMETLGEFVGLRSRGTGNNTSSPSSTAPSATAPTPVANNTTRDGRPVVITNEISSHEKQMHSPGQPLPPTDHNVYRSSTKKATATVINAARKVSEVYMCPVAPTPSTPREHEYMQNSYGHHRHSIQNDTHRHVSPVVLANDEPIPNLSSLNVLPEENEPLVAIDDEESGRTSMRAVRDEESSSISYYQPRPRASLSRPRSPSPVAHVSYAHVPPSAAIAATEAAPLHRQRRLSARPNRQNQSASNHTNSKNRVKSTSAQHQLSKMMPSPPILQYHQHQSHPYQQQYPQQAKPTRFPQEQQLRSHRRTTTSTRSSLYRPPESDASTMTEATNCSSRDPFYQHYSPVQDSDTVRAVAPRKPPTGTFSQEESSAVSSTGQQKVMIVVVRRPNQTNSSPHRHQYHSNEMELGLV